MARQLLFTGFEPFGPHPFNPSAIVAERAARAANAAFELLPVDFETARVAGKASRDYDVVVHVGLAAATDWIRLERFAHNLRMSTDDAAQEHDPDQVEALDDGPVALATNFDVAQLRRALTSDWDVRHSRDAGTYVCNATYYWSLRLAPETVSLFVHVPEWDQPTALDFGAALGAAVSVCAAKRA